MNDKALADSIDRVIVAVRDLGDAEQVYTRLLGRDPSWHHDDPSGGTTHLIYRLANASLEFVAPKGDGPAGADISQHLDVHGEGLHAVIFATSNAADAAARLTASGVSKAEIQLREARVSQGQSRSWRDVVIPAQYTRGLSLSLREALPPSSALPAAAPRGNIAEGEVIGAFDHLVVMTPEADEVKALFGDRLGIRLALDHSRPEWGVRQLFFRLGGMTLEVVQSLDAAKAPKNDFFWGLAWKVASVRQVRERLLREGVDVSEVRVGRKKGTEVATIRKPTCGIPTLLVGPTVEVT